MKLKIQLYILSLWLLFILLFINKVKIPLCFSDCKFIGWKNLFLDNIIPTISIVIVLLGFIFYFRFKYIVSGNKSLPEKVTNIENINWEHLTFLVTYVIPLLSFDLDFNLDEDRNSLMFFLVLIIIGLIYVKTNMFYTNPTLAILGYHIYKISTTKRNNVIFISKDVISEDDWIEHKLLSDNIYIANKSKKNESRRT
ncbi:anti-phage protein KwaA [Flavobacterium sp. LC2016-01]|uniref:anti-phage protein KwaA n=1 Tax=Flavobacterium sp. LC2016-01 TaxID=2675876 RepID=UPI0018ACC6F0|nr:anti-phage protein KwaA [Flavobacterium sp. LC2016-01]